MIVGEIFSLDNIRERAGIDAVLNFNNKPVSLILLGLLGLMEERPSDERINSTWGDNVNPLK